MKYKGVERTHLKSSELFSWLNTKFEHKLSAMTVLIAQEKLGIKPFFAGGEYFYTAAKAERILSFIQESETEYKNGYIVFSGQWQRDPPTT